MAQKQKTVAGLALGALGVVFGDIGTSPLYALRVLFSLSGDTNLRETSTIYGLLSILLWTVFLVVSVKYLLFIMRADNKGEGGIMALVALIRQGKLRRKALFTAIGLAGVALFYGDSVVTPAISVLSAIEGVSVVAPGLRHIILPLTIVILAGLFAVQRYGTAVIGRLFGPVMLVWFTTIGLAGAWRISQHPDVLQALSPLAGLSFIVNHPLAAFVAMAAVVLAVTGAEALYADMGHFGRKPIARAWFWLVLPALALCYLGQGSLLAQADGSLANPFFSLFPSALVLPAVVLATTATLIASQSVISGAFSLTRQAIQLGFLPRMQVRQTSESRAGQIYLPLVNGLMFGLVVILVVTFGSSDNLAGAYGLAVSGALLVDSLLFAAAIYGYWHTSGVFVACFGLLFISLDSLLVAANLTKIPHGGWVPLAIGAAALLTIHTWVRGQTIVRRHRQALEPPLQDYITGLRRTRTQRIAGQAVYIGHHQGLTPTALRATVDNLQSLHRKAVIVYVTIAEQAHIPPNHRVVFDELGYADGISQVTITYGYHDHPDIPRTLHSIRNRSPELRFDPYQALYFVSLNRAVIEPGQQAWHRYFTVMPRWQKQLYSLMLRNSWNASDYYRLPVGRTMEIRTLIEV